MSDFSDLRFRVDWQPVDEGVRSPELRASFGRLEIWVGDDCVTWAEDGTTGSGRRAINVSLYPLAEWIVFNWWRLQFDGRPSRTTARAAMRSHSTRFAGDGFCWPDLRIVPEGAIYRLQWERQRQAPNSQVAFLSTGVAWGRRPQVLGALEGLVEVVLDRLREASVIDTVLEKEWAAIRSLDSQEVDFCRAVARLGVDPLAEGVDLADDVDSAFTAFGEGLALELLDAAGVEHLREDTIWMESVISAMQEGSQEAGASAPLQDVRAALASLEPKADDPPWIVGWHAARAVRRILGLPPDAPFPDERSTSTSVSELGDRGLVAAGVGTVVVLTRPMGDRSRRFVSSRALIHAASASPTEAYLLTRSTSTNQAIGRAFAAELLVPAEGLREMIGDEFSAEEVARLADHYQAPDQVVKHQIENQITVS